MKATGIVRRIDDLGRVVIPKEIRRSLRIQEGAPLEIFVDRDGEVILKKYSPIGELQTFAQTYTDSLHESTGHLAVIADTDRVVAASGTEDDWSRKSVPPLLEACMQERRAKLLGRDEMAQAEGVWALAQAAVAPIIAEGAPVGVVLIGNAGGGSPGEAGAGDDALGQTELKLAETAAGFLARQIEQ